MHHIRNHSSRAARRRALYRAHRAARDAAYWTKAAWFWFRRRHCKATGTDCRLHARSDVAMARLYRRDMEYWSAPGRTA